MQPGLQTLPYQSRSQRKNTMAKPVIDKIIAFLKKHPHLTLDITGGAPE
jgi:hypothetical protein